MMRRGPSIRYLLLLANVFIVALPVAAIIFFQLWDTHLVRVTEERLISESVLIAEAWREQLLVERGLAPDAAVVAALDDPLHVPPEATLDLNYGVLAPAIESSRTATIANSAERRAAMRIEPLLIRAKKGNLSGVRILDAGGCVVATTGEDLGECLDHLEEVKIALAGRYAAVARERISDDPPEAVVPPSRRGTVRVFAALPVNSNGNTVGVVRMSRTSVSPLEAFWNLRYTVLIGLVGCLLLMTSVTFFFSRAISKPVVDITAAAESIARGEPPHAFVSSGIQPAEIASLRTALDRMTAQLTDKATYISQFAANVSHELKTPITAIRGAVELLQDQWSEMTTEQRERFLQNVDADAARMERLVTRLLQLARIQSTPEGAERVRIEPFFQDLVARYGDGVQLELKGAPVELAINPDHLETAVHNLIDNAVRHGNGKPVQVSVSVAGGRMVVRVQDHGPGISEGNRSRIFHRFFTTERDRGGTGLGLAIVHAVAETRGGNVTFETSPDGTTFTLVV